MNKLSKAARNSREDLLNALETALYNLNEWRETQLEAMQEYAGERSEKWEESDKGQAYAEWVGLFEDEADGETVLDFYKELPEAPES